MLADPLERERARTSSPPASAALTASSVFCSSAASIALLNTASSDAAAVETSADAAVELSTCCGQRMPTVSSTDTHITGTEAKQCDSP